MLVDNITTLEKIFSECKMLIAVHCEDENIIQYNLNKAKEKYGNKIPISMHPEIRSVEACYSSSSMAVKMAKKHNTRLHVFHISTEKELELFDNKIPLNEKLITSEVCIHHLYFHKEDYNKYGSLIKWNPAIKERSDKDALLKGLLNDKLDVIATDHAPHTLDEKNKNYLEAPSGGPLVQHALPAMLELVNKEKINYEKVVEKMCHNPAICFQIEKRGFIKEGFYADLVLINPDHNWKVQKSNILYKCKWSPFEGREFSHFISHTFVNGNLVYENGVFNEEEKGMRLKFIR